MNELLHSAIEAHGGLARWRAFARFEAEISASTIIELNGRHGQTLRHFTFKASTSRQRTALAPLGISDRVGVLDGTLFTVESLDGEVLLQPQSARDLLSSVGPSAPWDSGQVGCFLSLSLWRTLTMPFLLTYPGASVENVDSIREDNEEWSGLRVVLPDSISCGFMIQTAYFGTDGLLRRVDYAIESSVGTRERSSFATGYRDFLGIKVATKHEIFAKNRDGSINRDTSGEFLIRAIQFA